MGAPTFSWVCTFVQTSEENIVAPYVLSSCLTWRQQRGPRASPGTGRGDGPHREPLVKVGSASGAPGGGSAPSCCAFTHRVAFEEGSGPRVFFKQLY